MEEVRLQKIIAGRGYCSRRKAEELILDGRVKVNGQVITELGYKASIDADIAIDNRKLKVSEKKISFVFNKPLGVLSSVKDDRGRKTVTDYFKKEPYRLYPAGRLDYNTSGCLIVTNDGELASLITHPSSHLNKAYIVTVEGYVSEEHLRMLHDGVVLEDGLTLPAKILLGKRNEEVTIFKIIIHEGRNRQVRRMCEAINHKVISLYRESVGMINCNDLKRGEYRKLTDEEVDLIKRECLDNKARNVIPSIRKNK